MDAVQIHPGAVFEQGVAVRVVQDLVGHQEAGGGPDLVEVGAPADQSAPFAVVVFRPNIRFDAGADQLQGPFRQFLAAGAQRSAVLCDNAEGMHKKPRSKFGVRWNLLLDVFSFALQHPS